MKVPGLHGYVEKYLKGSKKQDRKAKPSVGFLYVFLRSTY